MPSVTVLILNRMCSYS